MRSCLTTHLPRNHRLMFTFWICYTRLVTLRTKHRMYKAQSTSRGKCLTHWGRMTHICVNKLTIIGSDNDLSPGWRQANIWTNAGILLIEPLETNFSEILIEIQAFSFNKMHLKMSSGKWRPSCIGLNELKYTIISVWGHQCCRCCYFLFRVENGGHMF